MKIFITGSNGFVGKNLISILKNKKVDYIAGDRKIYGDICLQKNWEEILKETKCIVHLAARVHVMNEKSSDPLVEFRKMNVDATIALAKSAKNIGVKRFIYLSSIKVNGEETFETPFSLKNNPAPIDPYGVSKMEAENELLKLHESGVFEVVIIRPPLIYGQGVKANFEMLLNLVNKKIPLPFGMVENKRSFVSVLNLCDLILKCIDHPNASGQIFLVSDDHDLSLKNLLFEMAKVKNVSIWLLPIPVWIMKVGLAFIGKKSISDRLFGNLQLDISHTKTQLEWKPPYSFQETFKN
jgi:UDP-glucose 4-epimerase